MLDALRAVLELEDSKVDPGELAALIDALQAKLCRVVSAATARGDHLLSGRSPVTWVAETCLMSKTSASDRLCVGGQLDSLPQVEQALAAGQIGYQATSVICHLSEQLGEKRDSIQEEHWIDYARRFSIKDLRYLAAKARYIWDPEGFEKDDEEDYDKRYLHLSAMGRMYKLDAVFDVEGGQALLTAIDALSKPLGEGDRRSPKQRRADAAVELAHRAMSNGLLPKRSGVRPHIAVTTTVEALRAEVGATASELHDGKPLSSKTIQRLACDGTLHRVMKADSMVIDVGRATRVVSGSQRRGVNARHRCCAWPGCDRPLSWTSVHHIQFWGRGGRSDMRNLVPLCYFHHRLVHEGGWQVVKVGESLRFVPPDREIIRRSRAPGWRLAA
ncbi:MAG TPA: DUF222 domain-containing protein [Candidatus Dormibacteraeota bacterium]|nr:DUF222 domain-containing protein [Candidatus Dormibacteraeota bacterium]